jgi:hypothetical protein
MTVGHKGPAPHDGRIYVQKRIRATTLGKILQFKFYLSNTIEHQYFSNIFVYIFLTPNSTFRSCSWDNHNHQLKRKSE